jgi:hypothetical protein
MAVYQIGVGYEADAVVGVESVTLDIDLVTDSVDGHLLGTLTGGFVIGAQNCYYSRPTVEVGAADRPTTALATIGHCSTVLLGVLALWLANMRWNCSWKGDERNWISEKA